MNYYEVIPTKIFRADANILTYQHASNIPVGTTVQIPLGKQKTTTGLVTKKVQKTAFPTKFIEKILYEKPLPPHLVKSLFWLHEYYACPLPVILQTALPKGIQKSRRRALVQNLQTSISGQSLKRGELASDILLNSAQNRVISKINSAKSNTVLLHGITGSGKTNIYLKLTEQTLNKQKSVILLVPEIALTSQLVQNFTNHFKNVTLLHSKQTESERHLLWEKILNSETPEVVIGPRSALFAPANNLGLIIIDEAHEPAYFQDQAPKYSATKLASYIASVVNKTKTDCHFVTLLGTATPTVADYYLADQQNSIISLDQLAIKSDKIASIKVIDFKNRTDFKKHRIISDPLLESIQNSLSNHTQSMIFHNRRGSAPLTICDNCGWQALCPNCLLPLTLHVDKHQLLCHTCGHKANVMTSCPECHHAGILHKGFGTKFLETELTKIFPRARIARFDADASESESLNSNYQKIKNREVDIIIGTQMIAKGFDFPHLTTLGVIQADAGLSLPDFSSEERTFQLLTQVIGRASRGHQNSKIFVQTYQPDHPAIKFGSTSDYSNFYNTIIKTRQKAHLPPFSFLLKLSLTYKTESACIKNIRRLREEITKGAFTDRLPSVTTEAARNRLTPVTTGRHHFVSEKAPLVISAPTPAFHEHTPKGYTWQLTIKAKSRQPLLKILQNLPKNPALHFYIDPPTLL